LTKNGHFALLSPLWGSLGATYTVHLRFVGKFVVNFLFVLTERFSLSLRCDERILIGNRRFWRGWVSFGKILT